MGLALSRSTKTKLSSTSKQVAIMVASEENNESVISILAASHIDISKFGIAKYKFMSHYYCFVAFVYVSWLNKHNAEKHGIGYSVYYEF